MLEHYIKPEAVNLDLQSEDKEEVFEELNEILVSQCPSLTRQEIIEALLARENKMTTGVVPGIAIPHAVSPKIKEPVFAIGISQKGIDFESLDGKPVHIVVMILFPEDDTGLHINIMQHFALMFASRDFYRLMMEKKTANDIVKAIEAVESSL